jgi:putative chitinase
MSNFLFTKKLDNKIPVAPYQFLINSKNITNITSSIRLAHFMAQIAHESNNFIAVRENLRYSSQGLMRTFSRFFPTKQIADQYAMQPEKIANLVYANRMGNGNELTGDGFRFRGRGYIQLTGKNNYRNFSDYIEEDCIANPDLVATKYPLDSALWFFDKNKLWQLCDNKTPEAVTLLTRRINGGTNGLADRQAKFKTFINLLSG